MNKSMIRYLLSKLLLIESVLLLVPVAIAIYYHESSQVFTSLFTTIGILVLLGGSGILQKPKNQRIYAKEGILIVALCWIFWSFFGGLPFVFARQIPSVIDAFFEISSGFTTTGATILNDVSVLSRSLLDSVGVQKNITKVNRTSLLEIINAPDFSSIITPKSIAVDTIMHFIRGRVNAQYSDLQAMHHLANGQIETLQFHIKEANKMTAKPLSQLKLKKGVLIAAIIRKGKTIFPTGEDMLEVGDKLLVTTLLPNITKIYDLIAR